ncbi:hypothetical protein QNI19_32205 [Cytophagaceae bacterium DM2B3-1]|uniref:Uncharacterized protein n=1 Tax=Xanthocytophaga flava TaxID=3048013 RepID=A0ABT7CXI8_9BACT|nr:hypothetical protein [Xanthocytophaga flavus]MDJ1497647.1 hypothetical protein [Xanthocytophaga flavus]
MIPYRVFAELPLDQKAELTWQSGTSLDCHIEQRHSLSLYALGDFYVQLRYDPQVNQIVDMIAFKDISRLSPYLDKITLPLL